MENTGRKIVAVLLDYFVGVAVNYEGTDLDALSEAYRKLYWAAAAFFHGAKNLEAYLDRLEVLLDERREGAAAKVLEALDALAQVSVNDADLARTLIMRTALLERVFAGSKYMVQFEERG